MFVNVLRNTLHKYCYMIECIHSSRICYDQIRETIWQKSLFEISKMMSYRNISSPPFCPFDRRRTFFDDSIINDCILFSCERTKGWQTALRIIFCLVIGHFDEDNDKGNLQWPPQRNTQISPKIKYARWIRNLS